MLEVLVPHLPKFSPVVRKTELFGAQHLHLNNLLALIYIMLPSFLMVFVVNTILRIVNSVQHSAVNRAKIRNLLLY